MVDCGLAVGVEGVYNWLGLVYVGVFGGRVVNGVQTGVWQAGQLSKVALRLE